MNCRNKSRRIFVEGLRPPGDLDNVFPIAANVADRDKPDAFFGPPFELIADDIVLIEFFEKADVSPSNKSLSDGWIR